MGRLIDADEQKSQLYEATLVNEDMDCLDFLRIAILIDAQPTAYDVDKVVKELEIERKTANNTYNSFNMDIDLGRVFGLEKAIEIVKAGGRNEK